MTPGNRLAALLALAGLALVLGAANWIVLTKERVIADGGTVLLELRPLDPRSLLQGDYMALGYDARAYPDPTTALSLPLRGSVVLGLDANGVGSFRRADDGGPLASDEIRLRYWLNAGQSTLRYGAESFLFQEGEASRYAEARYAVLKVTETGDSVLVALADADRTPIDTLR